MDNKSVQRARQSESMRYTIATYEYGGCEAGEQKSVRFEEEV